MQRIRNAVILLTAIHTWITGREHVTGPLVAPCNANFLAQDLWGYEIRYPKKEGIQD